MLSKSFGWKLKYDGSPIANDTDWKAVLDYSYDERLAR
jgi:hypothetical protein